MPSGSSGWLQSWWRCCCSTSTPTLPLALQRFTLLWPSSTRGSRCGKIWSGKAFVSTRTCSQKPLSSSEAGFRIWSRFWRRWIALSPFYWNSLMPSARLRHLPKVLRSSKSSSNALGTSHTQFRLGVSCFLNRWNRTLELQNCKLRRSGLSLWACPHWGNWLTPCSQHSAPGLLVRG